MSALGYYGDDMYDPTSGRDMGETARRINEESQLRKQYDYLFAAERARLEQQVHDLEARNADLSVKLGEYRSKVSRLESAAAYAERKKSRGSGPKPKERNRVIYWVTACLDSDAAELGAVLWQTRRKRGDGPEDGMKVVTYAAEGNVLKLVIDYTVKGGNPQDIWREEGSGRPGMLNRVAARLGVQVLDIECDERSRVPVDDSELPSNGS